MASGESMDLNCSGTTRHQHDTASTSPGAIIDRRLRKDITDRSTWNLSDFSTGILNYLLTIPSKLLCALVFIYRLRLVAAQQIQGVDGDDFANNLFTDLSPILALFGEQVTKQFMAQATTWEDNILFAMAPIGVLTAMISAIRISGPQWLRALVGRARESRAIAESELTTSTSGDVCELWNGLTIVRTLGSPRVLQLIFLPHHQTRNELGLHILDENAQLNEEPLFTEPKDTSGLLRFWDKTVAYFPPLGRLLGRREVELQNSDIELARELRRNQERSAPEAPNIYLNLRPPSMQMRVELILFTIIAVLLQAGVLVFGAITTYHPSRKLERDEGQAFPKSGYPLMATGTGVLVLGMWMCSWVVEKSTTERRWSFNPRAFQTPCTAPPTPAPISPDIERMIRTDAQQGLRTRRPAADTMPGIEKSSSILHTFAKTSRDEVHVAQLRSSNWSSSSAFDGSLASYHSPQRQSALAEQPPYDDLYCPPDAYVLWVQQGGSVNDQQFGSYTIFAQEVRKSFITSRLEVDKAVPFTKFFTGRTSTDWRRKINAKASIGKGLVPERALTASSTVTPSWFWQTAATTAALVSLAGFIVQFTGLRSMHWSTSVAQLTATVIMLFIRAVVRRHLAFCPSVCANPQNHELDWLAVRLCVGRENIWPDSGEKKHDDPENLYQRLRNWIRNLGASRERKRIARFKKQMEKYDTVSWTVLTGSGLSEELKFSAVPEDPLAIASDVQRTVKIRERLGELSGWTCVASEPAISLAKAIEIVLDALIGDEQKYPGTAMGGRVPDRLTMTWGIKGEVNGLKGRISFTVWRVKGHWRASATEIEAVLSLWLYEAQRKDEEEDQRKAQFGGNDGKGGQTLVWDRLCDGNVSTKRPTLRLLGPKAQTIVRDLVLYADTGLETVLEVTEKMGRSGDQSVRRFRGRSLNVDSTFPKTTTSSEGNGAGQMPRDQNIKKNKPSTYDVDRHMVVGFQSDCQKDSDISSEAARSDTLLAVHSYATPELLFVQDMFSSFMWAVARAMPRLENDRRNNIVDRGLKGEPGEDWKSFKFTNKTLATLVRNIERVAGSRLGTVDDINLSMFVPLSWLQKLPTPHFFIEEMRRHADEKERDGDWDGAAQYYLRVADLCHDFEDEEVRLQIMVNLFEFGQVLERQIQRLDEGRHFYEEEVLTFRKLQKEIEEKLALFRPSIHARALAYLYSVQGKPFNKQLAKAFPVSDEMSESPWNLLQAAPPQASLHSQRSLDQKKGEEFAMRLTPLHYTLLPRKKPLTFILRELLRTDTDYPKTRDILGRLPVHYAVRYPDTRLAHNILSLLLNHNSGIVDGVAEVNAVDTYGYSPLHYCALPEIALLLMENGAEPDIRGRDGMHPLHVAAMMGREGVCQVLISRSAESQCLDTFSMSPLHWAALHGHAGVMKLLLENGADKTALDQRGRTPLQLALLSGKGSIQVHKGSSETVFDILRPTGEWTDFGKRDRDWLSPVMAATLSGNQSQMKAIVDKLQSQESETTSRILLKDLFTTKDKQGHIPLHWAARLGNSTMVEYLVRASSSLRDNINDTALIYDTTPLLYAVKNGHVETAQILLENGASPLKVTSAAAKKRTILHLAAESGNLPMLKMLHEKVLNRIDTQYSKLLYQRDTLGFSPLSLALVTGTADSLAAAELLFSLGTQSPLIEPGIEPFLDEETPFHKVARSGSVQAMNLLLKYRPHLVNLMCGQFRCYTPLHIAAEAGNLAVMELLIEAGANLNQVDNAGYSALHLALQANTRQALEAARLLLQKYQVPLDKLTSADSLEDAPHVQGTTQKQWEENFVKKVERLFPIHVAVRAGSVEGVSLLLELGANVNTLTEHAVAFRRNTPLHIAVAHRDRDVIAFLLSRKEIDIANPDGASSSVLHQLLTHAGPDDADIIHMLLDAGADPVGKDPAGCTPMRALVEGIPADYEVQYQAAELIKKLSGVLPLNVLSADGKAPLHVAAKNGYDIVVEALLNVKGADVGIKDSSSRTPIQYALQEMQGRTTLLLWKHGASPKYITRFFAWTPDFDGRTLMHWAAAEGSLEQVRWLMENPLEEEEEDKAAGLVFDYTLMGFDLTQKDHMGEDAFHLAAKRTDHEGPAIYVCLLRYQYFLQEEHREYALGSTSGAEV